MTLPTIEDLMRPRQPPPAQPLAAPAPDKAPPVPKNVEEAVKLTATFVNNLAIGLAITGGVAPIFAFLNGTTSADVAFWQVGAASVVCFVAAGSLHYVARRYVYQELRP